MPTIQVAGLETYYEQIGSGPVLLLLHGWANAWEAWLPVIPFLSDHFTLILPDLPGCGRTGSPQEGWSTAQHARWLEALIHSLSQSVPEFELIGCVGHSYGGKMLLEFCSGNYEGVPNKIVLIDASGIPNVLNKKQQTLAYLSSLTPRFLKERLSHSVRAQIYTKFGAESDYITANAFQQQTLQKVLTEDYTTKLAKITQPTLLIWGKNDESTPLWQAESMHALLPYNELHVFDADHFPHHTYPEKVSADITTFFH